MSHWEASADALQSTGATLLELVERCEKASGPDRALDRRLAEAANITVRNEWLDEMGWADKDGLGQTVGDFYNPPEFTASIDAAMTLVPEGWRMVGMSECERGGWYASAFPRDPDAMGIPRTFAAHSATLARGEAPTPALALCIAALKARAETPKSNPKGDHPCPAM